MKTAESKRLDKNAQIKATRLETKRRRQSKIVKSFTCKIDKSHLSKNTYSFLKTLFLEAKWFINDILRDKNIFDYDYKTKVIAVMNKDQEWKVIKLNVLSSQIRQEMHNNIKQDIINLSKLKKKGIKVGRLNFKKFIRAIPLIQFGTTFKILKKHIKIQNHKKALRVSGLHQIPKDAEIAKAALVRSCGDYYLKITCFIPPETHKKTGKSVGLDFGIETTVTTSDGEKFNIKEPETKRLRKLRKGFHVRTKKESKNRQKRNEKIKKELERIDNRKKDQKNKLVRYLVDKYDTVVCQDESLEGWKKKHGAGVQQSCIKGIISDLQKKSETFILVDKWFPSTKQCDVCGNIRDEIPIWERLYECVNPECNNTKDRDIHSAINILKEGLGIGFPRLIRNVEDVKTPVELMTSIQNAFIGLNKSLTMNQEASLILR